MRARSGVKFGLFALGLGIAALLEPRTARAEADTFGIGNGHSAAYTAAALDEVVNAYAPLSANAAIGATSLTLGATVGTGAFAAGDLVMIWRATGLDEADAASGAQTRINLATASGGVVGRYELARVQNAAAGAIALTAPLTQAFAAGVTQVVRIPEYTTVSIPVNTSIVAAPWQAVGPGFAGGIVAFVATGAVTNDGEVSADAKGFRGGRSDESLNEIALACPNNDGVETGGYAAKGEGVVSTRFGGTTNGGRGNRANGGGGGNCVETGGAGGGHAGQGGAGGNSLLAAGRGGLGGAAVDYSLSSRLGMGGGGGAGEQKNGVGSGGGAGGGVVFVRSLSIAGAGVFSANGETAANAGVLGVESDGAGGGGAGGSILLRAVDSITCGSAETKGGNGGTTTVIGLGFWGPGGGGGAGRAFVQAKTTAACPIVTTPGASGESGIGGGGRGAAPGGPGETQPSPPTPYCFSNPLTGQQCGDPVPVCDVSLGECKKCTGPFGSVSTYPCPASNEPVCAADGACNACDGDQGSGTANACQLSSNPHCFLAGSAGAVGSCGKCTSNADCTGHAGPACNVAAGRCGAACTDDSQCKNTEWCAQNVCIPKTPNSDPLPTIPPIDGECTTPKGQRACLSSVCEEDDDRCGLRNGRACDGPTKCRSAICFSGDAKCGKPSGEPCAANGECRSDLCKDGVCSGCDDDSDCPQGNICELGSKTCVPGCRVVNGTSNCPPGKECNKKDGTVGMCVDAAPDAGPDAALASDLGTIEGGGCSCHTSPSSTSPLAFAGAAAAAIAMLARRRPRRRKPDAADDADARDSHEGEV